MAFQENPPVGESEKRPAGGSCGGRHRTTGSENEKKKKIDIKTKWAVPNRNDARFGDTKFKGGR